MGDDRAPPDGFEYSVGGRDGFMTEVLPPRHGFGRWTSTDGGAVADEGFDTAWCPHRIGRGDPRTAKSPPGRPTGLVFLPDW